MPPDAGTGSDAFLDWLPTALPYSTGPLNRVLVVGAGGGAEVRNAVWHGARRIVAVELHVGIGFYRVLVKWTAIDRRNLAIVKWGLTVAFLAIGYAILVGFWTYGNQLLGS